MGALNDSDRCRSQSGLRAAEGLLPRESRRKQELGSSAGTGTIKRRFRVLVCELLCLYSLCLVLFSSGDWQNQRSGVIPSSLKPAHPGHQCDDRARAESYTLRVSVLCSDRRLFPAQENTAILIFHLESIVYFPCSNFTHISSSITNPASKFLFW